MEDGALPPLTHVIGRTGVVAENASAFPCFRDAR